jgi:hypothetical protein
MVVASELAVFRFHSCAFQSELILLFRRESLAQIKRRVHCNWLLVWWFTDTTHTHTMCCNPATPHELAVSDDRPRERTFTYPLGTVRIPVCDSGGAA